MVAAAAALIAVLASGVVWLQQRGSSDPSVVPSSPSAADVTTAPPGTDPLATDAPPTAPALSAPVVSVSSEATVWAPTALPEGWTLWQISTGATPRFSSSVVVEQLFGERDVSTGRFAPGLVVKVSDEPPPLGVPANIAIGGADAYWVEYGLASLDVLTWSVDGAQIAVGAVGLDRDRIIEIAAGLRLRPDPLDGVDPSSVPPDLPFQEEWHSTGEPVHRFTVYWASPPGGPDFTLVDPDRTDDSSYWPRYDHVVRLIVNDDGWPGVGLLPLELALLGELQPDGTVLRVPGPSPGQLVARLPTGETVTVTNLVDALDLDDDTLRALALGFRQVTVGQLRNAVAIDDAPLRGLPLQAATSFADLGVDVEVRGPDSTGAAAASAAPPPFAVCARSDGGSTCRMMWTVLGPFGSATDPSVGVITLGGRRFAITIEPLADAPTVVLPWAERPNAGLDDRGLIHLDVDDVDPMPSTVSAVGVTRISIAEIPADVELVQFGVVDGGTVTIHLTSVWAFSPA